MGVLTSVSNAFFDAFISLWDVALTFSNMVLFNRPVGEVTPPGQPGYGGHWPEYRQPKEGDSRCCCPGLNTMANHGIINRNGRNIKFTDVTARLYPTYNFSPSFSTFTGHYAARTLKKDFYKDSFDLEELDLHNGIEHDASLTRVDSAVQPKQGDKCVSAIEELLSFATEKDADGNPLLCKGDISRFQGKRRSVCKATNKDFSLSLIHRLFGSANSSTLLTIFGGRVDDLRTILLEERLPEDWESRVRRRYGLTLLHYNLTYVLPVEFGTKPSDWEAAAQEAVKNQAV